MRVQGILILSIILLTLAVVLAFSWGKIKEVESLKFQEETVQLTSQVNELDILKMELQGEIDSLMNVYWEVEEANNQLQKKVSKKNKEVAEKNELIAQIQDANFVQTMSLTEQIKQLIATKAHLQTTIHTVTRQNDSLVVVINVREEERRQARIIARELAAQNNRLELANEGLTLKNFKATAFLVELESSNGKVMSKGRRVKRIKVSFALNEIPEMYRGNRPIYLVIKNEMNHPISTQALFPALIQGETQSINIAAVMRREANIDENQRLNFIYDVEEKLESGYYEVEIYTDIALLGVANFRVG